MLTPCQFIQLILKAYHQSPATTEIVVGNSHGLNFNAVMRMPLQQLRQMYQEEMERTKNDKWLNDKLKDQTITNKEAIQTTDGIIIRGKALQ